MGTASRSLTDREIAGCFNTSLGRIQRVRLVGGGAEPLYLPAPGLNGFAVIRYTHDYPASALHELAHWCIAGAARRGLPDYGYWYQPPPRTRTEQAAFAKVELRVQALESRLAEACGLNFRVSIDDVAGIHDGEQEFAAAVAACSSRLTDPRLPVRARTLLDRLRSFRARR